MQDEQAELGVGFAEELHDEAEQAVEAEKQGEHGPVRPPAWGGPGPGQTPERPEDEEEQDPLESGLVELGGMAGLGAAVREDHAPGHGGDAAKQLAVDEVAQPAEKKTDRRGDHVQVGGLPEVEAGAAAVKEAGHQRAQAAAVETHAARPDGRDLQRMGQVVARVVEEHVAQAAAEHHPEDQGQVEVVELGQQAGELELPGLQGHQPVGGEEAEHVHQAVPADLQRPQGKDHRVDGRIGQHGSALRLTGDRAV